MQRLLYQFITVLFVTLISCSKNPSKNELLGKWTYTKYEFKNKSLPPPDKSQIAQQQPTIIFYPDGKAEILSSGKILSHGSFKLDGRIIRYEEVLSDNGTRQIPFLIQKLENNQLIFETMSDPVQIIHAQRN